MNFSTNKSICPLAWMHIASHTDGSARLCCVSDRFIKDENNNTYNLGNHSIDTILNSDDFNSIRKDMLDGKLIQGCENCYRSEQYSNNSHRTKYLQEWGNDPVFQHKITRENIDTVEFFDLRFGNLCNLSCRYCNAETSSAYNKEIKNINQNRNEIVFVPLNVDYNLWYETEVFNKGVYEQIPNLRKYYAAGGEPTLIEKNYEFMEHMVKTEHSKHIELQISTNLTNTKKDFYSLLPFFKKVTFFASIDGVGDMQEYIRHPSNWNQIDTNFRKVVALPHNISVIITPVLQKTNLEHITELLEYAETFNRELKKNKVTVAPIILNYPEYYDFAYLPLDYKKRCLDKINDWVTEKGRYQGLMFHSKLKTIREKCIEDKDYQDNLREFFKYTDIFDSHRGHSLNDINPSLARLRDK